jgi:hypothetical protein
MGISWLTMATEFSDSRSTEVQLTIAKADLAGPVLERLVSAAAARADLTVDRMFNALTAVDALVDAADTVLDGEPIRKLSLKISPGTLELAIVDLHDGEAEKMLEAAKLPPVGDVLGLLASSVDVQHADGRSSLSIMLS